MPRVKLTVVGCSPAWPNPGGAQSGYLLEHDADSVLLDCGPGVLSRLRRRDGWPQPRAIAITHFHLDHWGDLVPWVWGAFHRRKLDEPTADVEVRVPPGGAGWLRRFGGLLGFAEMFDTAFTVLEYEPGEPFGAGGFEVVATRVPHYSIEAYAFRVAGGDRVLAYSGDSGPDDALASVARDADLFLCEATLRNGDSEGGLRGHLSLDEATAAFDASGARELLLTHRPFELPMPEGHAFAHDGLEREI
jgi:ribonuclease BN (tRNA processing enzyme)